MNKTSLLILSLSVSLFAANANFNEAAPAKERVLPMPKNTVLSYNSVLQRATSSIVHISTTHKVHGNDSMQDFLKEFFGHEFAPRMPRRKSTALGSGVILNDKGYIITNNHVIDKADTITVTLPGNTKEYEATLIGTDPKTDLAVIKISTKDTLNPILMGDSSTLKVGDLVFAIGNPFGVGQSVTQGIISARQKSGIGINEYENFIQTDASINPGNSGGALVDSRGVLIGINTAILSRSGGNNGIGFAIDVNMVKNVVQKLIEDGKVTRGYMGVQIDNLNNNIQDLYNNKSGALLIDVGEGSPAQKAGLKRGDLITRINSHTIKSASDLKNRIGMLNPGLKIKVEYERNKKMYTVELKLENQELIQSPKEELLGGLMLIPLNDNIRYQYRIPSRIEGLLVNDIIKGGMAEQQGIQKGDIIIQIEEYKVSTIAELKTALNAYKGQYKRVYINRGGRIFMVALK